MPGFLVTVSSNNRTWYLIGTIVFVLVGLGLLIGGISAANTGLAIVGGVATVAAAVLLIDAILNFT